MAIVVEDGTGLSGAESYNSVSTFDDYVLKHGLTVSDDATDEHKEQAMRRAAVWLDSKYRARWSGYKVNNRDQALEWPRSSAFDYQAYGGDGWYILPSDEVPVEVINAHAEATVREIATPGSLSPDFVASTQIARARVEGAVDVTYRGASGADAVQPIVVKIDHIMSKLFKPSSGASLSARAIRG